MYTKMKRNPKNISKYSNKWIRFRISISSKDNIVFVLRRLIGVRVCVCLCECRYMDIGLIFCSNRYAFMFSRFAIYVWAFCVTLHHVWGCYFDYFDYFDSLCTKTHFLSLSHTGVCARLLSSRQICWNDQINVDCYRYGIGET